MKDIRHDVSDLRSVRHLLHYQSSRWCVFIEKTQAVGKQYLNMTSCPCSLQNTQWNDL